MYMKYFTVSSEKYANVDFPDGIVDRLNIEGVIEKQQLHLGKQFLISPLFDQQAEPVDVEAVNPPDDTMEPNDQPGISENHDTSNDSFVLFSDSSNDGHSVPNRNIVGTSHEDDTFSDGENVAGPSGYNAFITDANSPSGPASPQDVTEEFIREQREAYQRY